MNVTCRSAFAAAVFLFSAGLTTGLRAESEAAAHDAALAKCIKILNYGDLITTSRANKGDAVVALGLLGDEKAVPVLIDHLNNESNNQLRLQIVRALGWIGTESCVTALKEAALHDKYVYVRSRAAAALTEITGKDFDYDHTGEDEMRKRIMDDMQMRKASREKSSDHAPEPTAPSTRGAP